MACQKGIIANVGYIQVQIYICKKVNSQLVKSKKSDVMEKSVD